MQTMWTTDALEAALGKYVAELDAAGRARPTIDAYEYRATRFLRWRFDHARPTSSLDELRGDVDRYLEDVTRSGAADKTIWTYSDGARRFVRWLAQEYSPRGSVPHKEPTRRATTPPAPKAKHQVTVHDLARAHALYREAEPRDLFYRAATDMLARAEQGAASPLTLGEALAVLLFTWNRAYYQYHPATPDHVAQIEALLQRNRSDLDRWRSSRLSALSRADEASIASLFSTFEALLGPVGAAKALHLLAPSFFPIWDRTIAAAYHCGLGLKGTNGPRYVQFMRATADQCRAIEHDPGCPADLIKALDEWNYVHFTKGLE